MPDSTAGITGSSTTARTTAASATTARTGTTGVGSLDKDAFLKLLVAQLKYQDPMSPTDPSAMMAQTAQFTMVESLQAISQSQADAGVWQKVVAGQGLIGKQVTGKLGEADVTGVVTSMSITADGPVLQLSGGQSLPVAQVLTVTAAPSATPAAAAPAAAAPAAAAPTATAGSPTTP